MATTIDPAYIINRLKEIRSIAEKSHKQYGMYPQETAIDCLHCMEDIVRFWEQRDVVADAMRLQTIREACGYIQDGSSTSITISQDDATGDWLIALGTIKQRCFTGKSFAGVIDGLQRWLHSIEKEEV